MKNINDKLSVENFFAIRSVLSPSFSKVDNNIYYITNTTGLPQIWRINPKIKIPEQVTACENAVRQVICNPKRKQLVYLSDKNGDENGQIYLLDLTNFKTEYISEDFKDSQCFIHGFSKDGKNILFSTNKRVKRNFDVYSYSIDNKVLNLLKKFDDEYATIGDSSSADNRYYTFIKVYHNLNQDIYLFDKLTGDFQNITKHPNEVLTTNVCTFFDETRNGFYFISNDNQEYCGLKFYNIKNNKSEWVIKSKGDITEYVLSIDFRKILFVKNYNAKSSLILFDIASKKSSTLKTGKGIIRGIEYYRNIFYIFENPESPPDLHLYKSDKPVKLTRSVPPFILSNNFTKARDVYLNSFDGTKVHALLFVPRNINKSKRNPAIVWVHGGPESQEVHNFNKSIQILTNEGYIVISPNYRGSTGYGKSYQKMIYKDWGGAELKDVISCIDLLKKISYVDIRRVAIGGGSFGGFMTLSCITRSSFKWRAAVDIFGPSNLFTFLRTIPEHWKKATDVLVGNIESDKELLTQRSPINYVDNISCPLLVVQGKHDPRVTENESTQIVNKLKKRNKIVEYILLEDEGHGFSKVSNQILVFKAEINFLNKYMV